MSWLSKLLGGTLGGKLLSKKQPSSIYGRLGGLGGGGLGAALLGGTIGGNLIGRKPTAGAGGLGLPGLASLGMGALPGMSGMFGNTLGGMAARNPGKVLGNTLGGGLLGGAFANPALQQQISQSQAALQPAAQGIYGPSSAGMPIARPRPRMPGLAGMFAGGGGLPYLGGGMFS